ncbi:4-amino-4-deoxychorismate lyase [Aliiroseovarius crassostreae]|uniref:Probable branched-chain-amino-acid aminotransferase n=1 Tax=Aliiroseovarius crassostreae TaxID=154981 RepID=A0A0P7J6A5_9RHOB|nr:aminotransferase class IV family protein [Aliiroseovarius crassostreae]KPN63722.1 hypothetical protein AKJ29_13980 [Aliiroseovarius crassostreae]SFU88034.1 4-amino-4-deoxychorismate lyase [Aliiroseovarius crassostreae]
MESTVCGSVPDGTELIETFALGPAGVARLDLHMARMARSAQWLGFPFDEGKARALLASQTAPEPLRARLTLAQDGRLDLTTAPLPASVPSWRFAIHPERLRSDNPWLLHKTTRRALYNDARAALPDGIDEWIFLNERGEICEGTITNIELTRPNGEVLTPPLSSGCLPGIYRQNRLTTGALTEAVLTPHDLKGATEIRLTNALRGATPAIWAPECPHFNQFA